MGFIDELRKLSKPYGEKEDYGDEDDFDDEDDEPVPPRSNAKQRSSSDYGYEELGIGGSSSSGDARTSKVVNIHTTAALQVNIAVPERFDSVSEIAEQLRDKHAVLLNLESTDPDVARRLVDFLSGCAYALDGKIKKVAQRTYLITPYNVDIVGDLMSELENSGMYHP